MSFFDRRIHLVTGKGGVGRTTVAVALAHAVARAGRRVLLAEIGDPEGGYSAIGRKFGREHLTPEPEPLAEGIMGCHLWAIRGHELFARSVIPAGPLIKAALASKPLRRFLVAAPSLHELGVLYHILSLLKEKNEQGRPRHEVFIVDMPATGHTLALTSLPAIILDLLPVGPMARAIREGQSYLNDPTKGAAWVVTLPEQLPVSEALELLGGLRSTEIPTGGVILNRMPKNPFTDEEHDVLELLLDETPMHGEIAFRRIGSAHVSMERLKERASVPVWELPEIVGPADEEPAFSLVDTLTPLIARTS
jgi:anion-transporting  ArsA/GET3 family ATPase